MAYTKADVIAALLAKEDLTSDNVAETLGTTTAAVEAVFLQAGVLVQKQSTGHWKLAAGVPRDRVELMNRARTAGVDMAEPLPARPETRPSLLGVV